MTGRNHLKSAHGEMLNIPNGVHVTEFGFRVSVRRKSYGFYHLINYETVQQCLDAAALRASEIIAQHTKISANMIMQSREHPRKKQPTGHVGINIQHRMARKGHVQEVLLLVNAGKLRKMIYVGTKTGENGGTWLKNYASKLDFAVALRQEMVQRNIQNSLAK